MPDDSSIEELRKKLYARAGGPKPKPRRKLRVNTFTAPNEWQKEAEPVVPVNADAGILGTEYGVKKRKANRIMRFVFAGSGLFFVASAGVAAWLFFSNHSVISNNNIDINISGPVSVPGGEEMDIQVEIVNHNPVPLILSDLIVEYPPGTKSPSDTDVDMPRTRESVGTIPPGGSIKRALRAVLFGVAGTDQKLHIVYEYQIEDSNALFKKNRDYSVLLSSAPVTIKVDALKEISPGQELVLNAHVISNSSRVLNNILLTAHFPSGFSPLSADPKPAYDANVWEIGDLAPGSERVIKITGTLAGQNTEERVFRFEAGSKGEGRSDMLATVFQTAEIPVLIKSPFINLSFNTQTEGNIYTIGRGDAVSSVLKWTNILPNQLRDLEVDLVLSGPLLDETGVSGNNGFYRSIDNTLIWSSNTDKSLAVVEPGENGSLGFRVGTKNFQLGANVRNPIINMVAHVKGKRITESGVPETLESTVSSIIKIVAEPKLSTRVVYYQGPFQNTGPIPPRADTETTYTVIWTIANEINDIQNATVVAQLPFYVTWLGAVSPQNAALTYEPTMRQVIWNVGSLPAGTGYMTQPYEVAFQISFTPSVSQAGSSQNLVGEQELSGLDQFTGTMLKSRKKALTTDLPTDLTAPDGEGSIKR